MLTPFKDEETGDYGYRDGERVVIPAEYDEAEEFWYGLAVVRIDEQYGVIDEGGKTVLPFEFDSAVTSRDWIQAEKGGLHSLYNRAGELVLQIRDIIFWYPPQEGIIRVKKDTGWGCIDLQGNLLVPFVYLSIGQVKNGWVYFYKNGGWGWMNTQGEVQVAPDFAEVGIWNNELWWGRKNGVYRLYDFEGKLFHDESWQKIIEPTNGIAIVKTKAGWKYIDESFRTILQLDPVYEWALHFRDNLAMVKKDGRWGLINRQGVIVLEPRWEKLGSFNEGLAAVQEGNFCGYINMQGELVIPFRYYYAGPFNNGRALVQSNWHEWYINTRGEDISPPVYIG